MYQFDMSGNVSIIIRAYSEVELLGVTYNKNDIISMLDNCYFEIAFNNNAKTGIQGSKNLFNINSITPDSIKVEPKSSNYSLFNFIAAEKNNNVNIDIPVKENITTDSNGNVFLNNIPSSSKNIFIKNLNRENVTGFNIDYNTGLITNLAAGTGYVIFYYYSIEKIIGYKLNKVEIPYFSLEIIGDTNINSVSRKILISAPKVSIDISSLLQFKENITASQELVFKIIDGSIEINYY